MANPLQTVAWKDKHQPFIGYADGMLVRACIFDVFGTAVDWRTSVSRDLAAFAGQKGIAGIDWTEFTDEWRKLYQPAIEEVRCGRRRWSILDELHRENLIVLLRRYGIEGLAEADIDHLNRAWHRLDPWPDVVEGLTRLKRKFIIAPCSNGNIALMVNMAKRAGLPWDCILGAETARAYKPQPEVYLAACRHLDLPPAQVMMVAAHNADLGEQRINGRMPIAVGDQIMLGAGGPVVRLESLDLGQRRAAAAPVSVELVPAGEPEPSGGMGIGTLLMGIALGAFAVLVVVFAIVGLRWQLQRDRTPKPEEFVATPEPTGPTPPTPVVPTPQPPVVTPPPPPPPTVVPALPADERIHLGSYEHAAKSPPSVLLEHRHGTRWARLKPGQRVYTASHLVSLPGYRSRIRLDSGANLDLWGNLPEFSAFPPVLESVVMLNAPVAGIDLDVTLERGRVRLSTSRTDKPLAVRMRFAREVWDLTLPDARSEAVVEHWGFWPRGVPFSREPGPGPERCVGLFVRGDVRLRSGDKDIPLSNQTRFTWTSASGSAAAPDKLERMPDWWTDRVTPDDDRRADMMLALQDCDELLGRTDGVLDALVTAVRESPTSANRRLGVLCLGALNAASALVDCLDNRDHADVRGTSAFVLRQWIARGKADELDLFAILCDRKFYAPEKAALILQFLHTFSQKDIAEPETYQRLIGYLNHDNLAVRDLALWHLALLAPGVVKEVPYRPTDPAGKRAEAVEAWRKRIPPGTVPKLPLK